MPAGRSVSGRRPFGAPRRGGFGESGPTRLTAVEWDIRREKMPLARPLAGECLRDGVGRGAGAVLPPLARARAPSGKATPCPPRSRRLRCALARLGSALPTPPRERLASPKERRRRRPRPGTLPCRLSGAGRIRTPVALLRRRSLPLPAPFAPCGVARVGRPLTPAGQDAIPLPLFDDPKDRRVDVIGPRQTSTQKMAAGRGRIRGERRA